MFGKGKGQAKRFEVVHSESSGVKELSIYRDKQTGVQYLFVRHGYGGGLSPLLDRDGKPVVDNVNE